MPENAGYDCVKALRLRAQAEKLGLRPARLAETERAVRVIWCRGGIHGRKRGEDSPLDYRDARPATALLVVEVADTTFDYDRDWKGSLYARAGIAEYWVVNLSDRLLEVYREPASVSTGKYGWEYGSVQRLGPSDSVSPLAAPRARVTVADLLP